MTANPFQKATRSQLKARVAFAGPTGAGKTWTSLEWATVLADGGRIAVVDTERGSASLYSDRFDFDVLTFDPPYEPGRLADILKTAESHGYAVVVVDSLSHFWEGEGGTLDMVDAAAQRAHGNSFAGWKVGTPALRHLIDTMLGLDAHLIATMRSKMDYVLEEDDRGKKVPRKIGMAPVMRAGVEYEFTLVGDLDLEHRLTITKSRCDRLADEMVQPGRAGDAAETFALWLGKGEPMIDAPLADSIAERLNAAGGDARKAWRSRFGVAPRQLRASQSDEAVAFVAEIEAGSASPTEQGEEGSAPSEEAAPSGDSTAGVNGSSSPEGPSPTLPEMYPAGWDKLIGPEKRKALTRAQAAAEEAGLPLPESFDSIGPELACMAGVG